MTRRTDFRRPTDLEPLEARRLLSAALHPNLVLHRSDSAASPIQGYSPSQIRTAYGFNQISFGNGQIIGDGRGQTIAIVDAYNDPNIAGDLQTFDTAFGLSAPPAFTQVTQTGDPTSALATDSGWAAETALDVEWAHAVAPGAKILLVEAASSSIANLLAAVNFARSYQGVSTVSMSWGGSEFNHEATYDAYFTTPDGHRGVTFVAAAGDNGSSAGPEWPSASPKVLGVGGTSLNTADAAGTYSGETGWSGGGGGISNIAPEPAYQQVAQQTGSRVAPDVSYDADPNTGFAVYDSVPNQGFSGWQVIGGTSAGAPQWAALLAIADQGRSLAHIGALDGATGTLPALYALYADPSAIGYANYASDFNDVVSGSSSFNFSATPGYDAVTGLGTPVAPQVVAALSTAVGTHAGAFIGLSKISSRQAPASPLSARQQDVHRNADARRSTPPTVSDPPPVIAQAPAPAPPAIQSKIARAEAGNNAFVSAYSEASAPLAPVPHSSEYDSSIAYRARGGYTAKQVAAFGMATTQTQADLVPREGLARLDAGALSGALSAFANNSAENAGLTHEGASLTGPIAITAAVVLGDLALVGYWYAGQSRRRAARGPAAPSPFLGT